VTLLGPVDVVELLPKPIVGLLRKMVKTGPAQLDVCRDFWKWDTSGCAGNSPRVVDRGIQLGEKRLAFYLLCGILER